MCHGTAFLWQGQWKRTLFDNLQQRKKHPTLVSGGCGGFGNFSSPKVKEIETVANTLTLPTAGRRLKDTGGGSHSQPAPDFLSFQLEPNGWPDQVRSELSCDQAQKHRAGQDRHKIG
jgi:hypothetical protein